uniref:Uncharacterized protein n=1 Tax=Utricularia reniformis TaxID=192314 RepID=A0A1Y0B207_9LAMI|nr:hypothetical protein AEK19_MT1191 [Utricularia reniformis]ART31403.1 hypothetical protein AEK19_MT1191 [Utricularia reniformis]
MIRFIRQAWYPFPPVVVVNSSVKGLAYRIVTIRKIGQVEYDLCASIVMLAPIAWCGEVPQPYAEARGSCTWQRPNSLFIPSLRTPCPWLCVRSGITSILSFSTFFMKLFPFLPTPRNKLTPRRKSLRLEGIDFQLK